MAHFDSAKNRVLWQRELADLREERKRRESQGFRPNEETAVFLSEKSGSKCQKLTFAEFEQEVLAASEIRKPLTRGKGKSASREKKLEPEKEMGR